MTYSEYLADQADRAERLAQNMLDALTVDRLTSFASECRQELQALNAAASHGSFSPEAATRPSREHGAGR